MRSPHLQGARGGQNLLIAGLESEGAIKGRGFAERHKSQITVYICLTSPRWQRFVGVVAEESFQEKFKKMGTMGFAKPEGLSYAWVMCESDWRGNAFQEENADQDRRKELEKLKDIEDKCPCFDMMNACTVCSELHMAVALRSDGWLAGGHWAVLPPPSSLLS